MILPFGERSRHPKFNEKFENIEEDLPSGRKMLLKD